MLLSEYIEYLQLILKNHGDAKLCTLDEVGFKTVFYDHIEPHYKIIKNAYYDVEKDEFVDDERIIDYYLIY